VSLMQNSPLGLGALCMCSPFAHTLLAAGLSQRVGLIPCAWGGTIAYTDWNPAKGGPYYYQMINATVRVSESSRWHAKAHAALCQYIGLTGSVNMHVLLAGSGRSISTGISQGWKGAAAGDADDDGEEATTHVLPHTLQLTLTVCMESVFGGCLFVLTSSG
jgi:hypothetical protein